MYRPTSNALYLSLMRLSPFEPTQWKRDYGGKKADKTATSRPLPFDCCALTLAPFEVILPYLT